MLARKEANIGKMEDFKASASNIGNPFGPARDLEVLSAGDGMSFADFCSPRAQARRTRRRAMRQQDRRLRLRVGHPAANIQDPTTNLRITGATGGDKILAQ